MERRTFIQNAFGATGLLFIPFGSAVGAGADRTAADGAVYVPANQDRNNEPLMLFGTNPAYCKVSTMDTNGGMYVFEHFDMPKGAGPARHIHHEQDEWLYAVEGEFIFEVGDERFHLKAGDSIYAPRMIPHVWTQASDAPGRLLSVVQPAGNFEGFFRELAKYTAPPGPEETATLFARFGMELVGPPLRVDG